MKKRWVFAIYIILIFILISGLITSCENLSSSLTPPNSEYTADIIGRVIIAKSITTGNTQPMPAGSSSEYWIVQTSIKNKGYQIPITSQSDDWGIIKPKSEGSWGILNPLVKSPLITIPQGQSGEMTLCFFIGAGLNPSDFQICYSGAVSSAQLPDPAYYSYGKLVDTNTYAEVYDWDSQKVVKAGKRQQPITNVASNKKPNGTYTSTAMGMEQTATFSGDTITRYDPIDGKAIFKYHLYVHLADNTYATPSQAQDANTIWVQDVVTKESDYIKFKYIPEQDIVVIADIPYYK